MSALLKLIAFFAVAGLVPSLMGLLPVSFLPEKKRQLHAVILAGYVCAFALFELVGLPVLLLTPMGDFNLLVWIYTILCLLWICAGIYRMVRTGGIREPMVCRVIRTSLGRGSREGTLRADRNVLFFWALFLILLAFEMIQSYRLASYDGDDSYYVVQSLQAIQTGTMYHYIPYTGVTTVLDWRHAMALLPMWIAWVAKLSLTHPTIVTHSMIPLVFLPLADLSAYTLLKELLGRRDDGVLRESVPAAMVVLSVLQIFGNLSIYTPESFLLLRTWQGKSVFVNILVPAAFTLMLQIGRAIFDQEKTGIFWALVFVLNLASGLCTSMAPVLLMALLMGGAVFLAIFLKKRGVVLKMLAACIPNLIFVWFLFRNVLTVYYWMIVMGGKFE